VPRPVPRAVPSLPHAARFLPLCAALACLPLPVIAQGVDLPPPGILDDQMAAFSADIPGSVMALQPFRNTREATGEDGTTYQLTSLNPHVNSWFLLEVTPEGGATQAYHLENADPRVWTVSLSDGARPELLVESDEASLACTPWTGALAEARDTGLPYAPICDWSLYLRNPVTGNRTTREAVAEFLRENVVFGESIVNMIKGTFFEDAFMESTEDETAEVVDGVALLGQANLSRAPAMRPYMGFDLEGTDDGAMVAGSWYAVADAPGIYASVMQPGMIAQEVLDVPGANWLDGIESRADVYLVAFDMSQFEIGYEVGTSHPAVDWSPRPSGSGRHYQGDGPDGFGRTDPLVTVGMLSPSLTDRVAATFTAGFKREHGAWRFGDYATFNWGHHYGFMTHGVTLSRLWPTLATLYMLDDGTVGMRSWTEGDTETLLPNLVFARQNGVPLIENGVPGDRVTSWGGGNWSGSGDADLRTLRGGACMRTIEGTQFLIYAYFSTATPSGMARTFQAYGCEYAMLLDMNSQEHTYMALYVQDEDTLDTQHLVRAMEEIDERGSDGARIPRFVSTADNRDFFYLLRRE